MACAKKARGSVEETLKPQKGAKKPSRVKENASQSAPKKKASKTKKTRLGGNAWGRRLKIGGGIACILVLVWCMFFEVSRVTSNAMLPALSQGDLVLTWRPFFRAPEFKPGDIVLVDNGDRDASPNCLRMIAYEDESVAYESDRLSINGMPLKRLRLTNAAIARPETEPEIWRESLENGAHYRIMLPQQALVGPLHGRVVARDGAFLVGDNRMASYDARQQGLFSADRLRGRVILVLESARADGLIARWLKFPR